MLSLLSKIIGIDILAGASSQKGTIRSNRFAAVVLEKGEIIESHNSITLKKLIRLCKQYEPKYLGVDNIFELEANSSRIIPRLGIRGWVPSIVNNA